MIQFGLRLHDAEKLPIEQVLPLVRQKGFSCVHLALSKSLKEVPNTPSALTAGRPGAADAGWPDRRSIKPALFSLSGCLRMADLVV